MNDLQRIFTFDNQEIRTVIMNGQPWFVAKDVCEVLEIRNSHDAIQRLDQDEKATSVLPTQFGNRELNLINESGLYSLIMTSRKPEAKRFKKWVTSEVLPSIRKHGAYMTDNVLEQAIANPDFMIGLLTNLKEEQLKRREAEQVIEAQRPAVEAHGKFMAADNLQTMAVVAKVLGYGRNTLFKILRNRKVLQSNNTPYQRYIDSGYFEVKEKPISLGEEVVNKPQTFVTAKGVNWLSQFLNKEIESA